MKFCVVIISTFRRRQYNIGYDGKPHTKAFHPPTSSSLLTTAFTTAVAQPRFYSASPTTIIATTTDKPHPAPSFDPPHLPSAGTRLNTTVPRASPSSTASPTPRLSTAHELPPSQRLPSRPSLISSSPRRSSPEHCSSTSHRHGCHATVSRLNPPTSRNRCHRGYYRHS